MRSGDRQPADPYGRLPFLPIAAGLLVVALLASLAVALGAPVALVAVPPVCVAALVVLWARDARRLRATAETAAQRASHIERLDADLVAEVEARRSAEARLMWRARLGSLRRARQKQALVDPESGLLLENWLLPSTETRIAAGRRRLTPVAVVMLEVVEDVDLDEPRDFDAGRTADLLRATVREADTVFRLDEGGFAVALEDTDDMGALLVTKRFGEAVEAMAPTAVIRAGVACYPAHGLDARAVLDRADEALDQARRWRQHRIEVAPAEH